MARMTMWGVLAACLLAGVVAQQNQEGDKKAKEPEPKPLPDQASAEADSRFLLDVEQSRKQNGGGRKKRQAPLALAPYGVQGVGYPAHLGLGLGGAHSLGGLGYSASLGGLNYPSALGLPAYPAHHFAVNDYAPAYGYGPGLLHAGYAGYAPYTAPLGLPVRSPFLHSALSVRPAAFSFPRYFNSFTPLPAVIAPADVTAHTDVTTTGDVYVRSYVRAGTFEDAMTDFHRLPLHGIRAVTRGEVLGDVNHLLLSGHVQHALAPSTLPFHSQATGASVGYVGVLRDFPYQVYAIRQGCPLTGYQGFHDCIVFSGATYPYQRAVRRFVYVNKDAVTVSSHTSHHAAAGLPLPYAPAAHVPVPYGSAPHVPLPYAPVSHVSVSYAPAAHVPLPYAPVSHVPVPSYGSDPFKAAPVNLVSQSHTSVIHK